MTKTKYTQKGNGEGAIGESNGDVDVERGEIVKTDDGPKQVVDVKRYTTNKREDVTQVDVQDI